MTRCILLPYHKNPEVYFNLLKHLPDFSWLDSGRPASTQGQYDIFTACAISHAKVHNNHTFECDDKQPLTQSLTQQQWFDKYTAQHPHAPKHLPFTGGVLGYLGYHWQDKQFGLSHQKYSTNAPHAQVAAFDWALIVDHHAQRCEAFFLPNSLAKKSVMPLLNQLLAPTQTDQSAHALQNDFYCQPFEAQTTKGNYLHKLDAIKQYILAGDCYQVNFSQRFSADYTGNLDTAYLKLRRATPSPFSAYLKTLDKPVLSVSPERFLNVHQKNVITQPIKGSTPRGQTPQSDEALADALRNSPKNRAENIMIVDLLRNDLSQCCEPFSVKVPHLCELHSFANVHHLISTVTGKLTASTSAFELFTRCFPGGSITGAPKKRAMQIIAELEDNSRDIYCGSVAYFSNNGNADSSITIRTLQADNNQLHCWGGGGIVIDSVAEDEFEESLFKVQKLMTALNS